MDYIKICGWDKFQHYKKRNPPWVKLYTYILDDDDFDCLPDDSKLLFLCLLPFASRRNNKVRLDLKWLQKKLPIEKDITEKTLQPLISAGFIRRYQDDSDMIAERKQVAMPEAEAEAEQSRDRYNQNSTEFILLIFNFWNKFKGRANFKGHRDLTTEIKKAISLRLKDYSVKDICEAIANYTKILIDTDFTWSYAWTLQQFLTRHNQKYREELQLYRFLPNNFREGDYFKEGVAKRRAEQRRKYTEHIKKTDIEKLKAAYEVNKSNLNWLIDELRPDVKEQIDDTQKET